jgi:sugar phosphate isomerase/epimerase
MAHAKDRQADGRVTAAGSGMVDFPRLLTALHKVGFNGPVVTHGLSAAEAPGVARFLRGCLGRTG